MLCSPPCKTLTANWTKGVLVLKFRDVKRWSEQPVSKKKKRGSDGRACNWLPSGPTWGKFHPFGCWERSGGSLE